MRHISIGTGPTVSSHAVALLICLGRSNNIDTLHEGFLRQAI
jgi:hypothetical protein